MKRKLTQIAHCDRCGKLKRTDPVLGLPKKWTFNYNLYKLYCDKCEKHIWPDLKLARKSSRLCDKNCNECPVINHPNSRMLSRVLNLLVSKFGDEAYKIIQDNCPNFTCCYDCHIDDFCHVEGCDISRLEKGAD